MVKLIFNPIDKNEIGIASLVSKKIDRNLNPFKDTKLELLNEKNEENEDPLSVKDLVGLENCAYVLKEWYYKSLNKMLLIIGPTGCGKTSLIELFCKEENINLYTIKSSENIKTKKDLLKDIYLFLEFSFFKMKENKLIFIDEYQNSQNDLLSITDITELKNCKIVIISSDSKGTKLSELKKISEVYYINEINLYYIKEWIKKLNFNFNENDLMEIIRKCKSDKRLLLNTLSFYNKSTFKSTLKPNCNLKLIYKDTDINLFEFIDTLFDKNDFNFNYYYKIYETDGFAISNLVHENYLDYNDDIDSIAKSADAISAGEILFSDTYESNKTFLPDAHFINSIYIPSFYSKSYKPSKNIRTSCINNRFNIYLNNKKLISKINLNQIDHQILNIFDILFIKKFLNYSLIKSKILTPNQEDFLRNIIGTVNINSLELIYKHFSEFKETKIKETKNFTLKFKEKINRLNGTNGPNGTNKPIDSR